MIDDSIFSDRCYARSLLKIESVQKIDVPFALSTGRQALGTHQKASRHGKTPFTSELTVWETYFKEGFVRYQRKGFIPAGECPSNQHGPSVAFGSDAPFLDAIGSNQRIPLQKYFHSSGSSQKVVLFKRSPFIVKTARITVRSDSNSLEMAVRSDSSPFR